MTLASTSRSRVYVYGAPLALVLLWAALRASAEPGDAESDEARRALAVATYDDGAVTVGEIEDTITDSSPLSQAHALEPDSLRELLERNLRFELLAQEAERRGYRDDPRVRKAVKDRAVQFMISRDINAPLRAHPPTPEELHSYFDTHRDLFSLRALRRASELVVESEAQAKALLPQFKAANAQTLRELVRKYGLDVPSKANAGDLRPFDASGAPESGDVRINPELAKVVFRLPAIGAVSDILQTDAGYVLLKLTEIRPGHTPSYEEVSVRVRRRFDDERYDKAINAIAQQQRDRLHPSVRYELVNNLHID